MKSRLPVTWVAGFLHRSGDLYPGLEGRTRGEEGIRVQRDLQRSRLRSARAGEEIGYERERAVSVALDVQGQEVLIAGRIDGLDLSAHPVVVEEFKTTRANPEEVHRHLGSEHWAQARLYAGMLVREGLPIERFLIRLCYCHPDTLAVQEFEETLTAAEARQFLEDSLAELQRWLTAQLEHERARNAFARQLAFPYGAFRPYQRAMARRAYRALVERESLLLEAPTGSGKTAAMLFPAVRTFAASATDRIFFLTSRSTGAEAALTALRLMDPRSEQLRFAQLGSRERLCSSEGIPCDRQECPMAKGYHDRAREALADLLRCNAMPLEVIEAVAARHNVCPHELSLDAAYWSDVVIGDYNYVFDPTVRLQRLANEPDAVVLIDEAHQLAPRVREMLGNRLSRKTIREAMGERPAELLAKRLRGIDRQLSAIARAVEARRQEAAPGAGGSRVGADRDIEWQIERPDALLRSLERFVDAAFRTPVPLETWAGSLEVFFIATRWLRDVDRQSSGGWLYRALLPGGERKGLEVVLDCTDPAPWIAERLGEYGGHIRFSGTVSPLSLYQRLHGFPGAPAERAGNPFHEDQLAVLHVTDIPTYLNSRARSLGRLVELVESVMAAKAGHYLVAFPSFDYLNRFAQAFAAAYPERQLAAQFPGMVDSEREEFIAGFRSEDDSRIGLVVLGGIFGESVDFSGAVLAGVVCVGLGLPPPSLARDALASHFESEGEDGRTIAYLQPAMVKIVQMAGRVLRGPDDRGLLCLVDTRFGDPVCQAFFPSHWRPIPLPAHRVPAALANFWRDESAFPRLRGITEESAQ